jgi:hypothetical protein
MRATSFSWAQGRTCHVSCHMPVVSCLCESSYSPTLLEPQLPAVALATPPVPATTLPLDDPLPLTTLPSLCLPNTPCDDHSITSDAQISGSHDTRRQCTLPLPSVASPCFSDMWVLSDLYRLSHVLHLDQPAPSWGPNLERDDGQCIGMHAHTLNLRNGHSKAYLLYSMPLMDEDDGARTGPSLCQPWCSTGPKGGGRQRIWGPATSIVGSAFATPAPAEEIHDAHTDLSVLSKPHPL